MPLSLTLAYPMEPSATTWICGSALAILMAAIALVDAREYRIPDVFSLPAIPLGLMASGRLVSLESTDLINPAYAIAACLGASVLWLIRMAYRRFRGVEGLGLGDVKLAGAAGAWVGLEGLPQVFLIACLIGLALALAMRLVRGADAVHAQTPIPFGTALAPAIWVVWTTNIVWQSV